MAMMDIDGIDVRVEGEGAETVVMIHGWPDTLRLWDAHRRGAEDALALRALHAAGLRPVAARPGLLAGRGGRDPPPHRHAHAAPASASRCWCTTGAACTATSSRCATRELVSRIVGVDIGDAGSKAHQAELGAQGQADGAGLPAVAGRCVAHRRRPGQPHGPAHGRGDALPGRAADHRRADGLPLRGAMVRREGRLRRGAALRARGAHALPVRPAQALHVPFAGLDRGPGAAARQPRRRPAHGALGDAGQAAGLQRRGGALAGRDRAPSTDR